MAEEIRENTGYISIINAMKEDNYVFDHQPIDDEEKWIYVLEQIGKINLEARDIRLKKLEVIVQQEKTKDTPFFYEKALKILMAILMDIDPEKYESVIDELALFHERESDSDEKEFLVSVIKTNVQGTKANLFAELNRFIVEKQFDQFAFEKEKKDDVYLETEAKNKYTSPADHVFIVHQKKAKKTNADKTPIEEKTPSVEEKKPSPKRSKSSVSSKQKIIAVLEKNQSFLIYKQAFPLPRGSKRIKIKRIRIKENFETVLKFIKDYIVQSGLPVDIIEEEDRAKVLFKKIKEKQARKNRNKVKIPTHAA